MSKKKSVLEKPIRCLVFNLKLVDVNYARPRDLM